MKKGIRNALIVPAALIALVLILSGCQFGLTPETTDPDISSFLDTFGMSYNVLANGTPDSSNRSVSRATITVGDGTAGGLPEYTFPPSGTSAPQTVANYPTVGMDTTFTMEKMAGTVDTGSGAHNYYKITATSTPQAAYVASYLESKTVEIYYVESADDTWTTADPVIDPTTPAVDPVYRDAYYTLYKDGSRRDFQITKVIPDTDPNTFAAFDINGSLEFPQGTGLADFTPTTDATAVYSSITLYTHEVDTYYNFWFWGSSTIKPVINGIQYYTEHTVNGQTVGTSLALEQTFAPDGTLLAQSVVRGSVTFDSNNVAVDRRVVMRTVIKDLTGGGSNIGIGKGVGVVISKLPQKAQEAILKKLVESVLPADAGLGDYTEVVLDSWI